LKRARALELWQRVPGRLCAIAGLEIFEKDAKRDCIHHQMMHGEQQPFAAVAELHVQRAQEWSVLEIEAALCLLAERVECRAVRRRARP
jgi:hypothetical protein